MGVRADGSAYCNRCNKGLLGAGVIYGMLAADLTPAGAVRQLIFCYDPVNRCRDVVLAGHLAYAQAGPGICADCGLDTDHGGIAAGMLTADLDPTDGAAVRSLLFCYANGSRDSVLAGQVIY